MRQLGIAPTLEMYTSLMDACVQAGETEVGGEGVAGAASPVFVVVVGGGGQG
jgi:hypothetical protein